MLMLFFCAVLPPRKRSHLNQLYQNLWSEAQKGSRDILDSVSHLSVILLGAFPSLVYDYWLDEYFHLGDLRAPHTFHVRKLSDLVLADLVLLPFLPFHSGLKPWLSLALPPISLRSACLTSSRTLPSLPSIPGAQVSLPLTGTDVSTGQVTSASLWTGPPGLPPTAKCWFYLFSAQNPLMTLHCSLTAFIMCWNLPVV